MLRRRVVITGAGTVTPFGEGLDPLWNGLREGRSALGPITSFDPSGFDCQLAGEVPPIKVKERVPKSYRKAIKVMARDIELAVVAAQAAVEHAGLVTKPGADQGGTLTYPANRVGCQIGAGLIAADLGELAEAMNASAKAEGSFTYQGWGQGGMNNLTPLWMLKYLPNMLACHVTIIHDAKGPSNTITCGEASGLLSIGESMRVIERGDADAAFAGGAESKVNPVWHLRLHLNSFLNTAAQAEDPGSAVRPFDADAPGGLSAEGAGILILEGHDTACERNADMLAELTGFGAGHAPRSTDPAARGEGLAIAIRAALNDAAVTPAEIDAVVADAPGVTTQDSAELAALRATLADRLPEIELVTLTPAIGHAFAGQAGIAAAVAARMLREQALPARLHAGSPPDGLRVGPAPARDAALRRVLVVASAAAGQNAALVAERPR